jgi:hypothetical protein
MSAVMYERSLQWMRTYHLQYPKKASGEILSVIIAQFQGLLRIAV